MELIDSIFKDIHMEAYCIHLAQIRSVFLR